MRYTMLACLLWAGCSSDQEVGDTDFWWEDGTGFQYDDCFDSPLVGEWAEPSNSTITLLTFSTDCAVSFAGVQGTSAQLCDGYALYDHVVETSGTVTMRANGSACATCSYNTGTSNLSLDCSVPGLPTEYIRTVRER